MRSGVERGAERYVSERDTKSCGELFFGPVSVKKSNIVRMLITLAVIYYNSDANRLGFECLLCDNF